MRACVHARRLCICLFLCCLVSVFCHYFVVVLPCLFLFLFLIIVCVSCFLCLLLLSCGLVFFSYIFSLTAVTVWPRPLTAVTAWPRPLTADTVWPRPLTAVTALPRPGGPTAHGTASTDRVAGQFVFTVTASRRAVLAKRSVFTACNSDSTNSSSIPYIYTRNKTSTTKYNT